MSVFLKLILFILFQNVGVCLSCDLINSNVDFQLVGEGFHRTLKVASNFSSSIRFINCHVSYLFQIPEGAFVDVDELNINPLFGPNNENQKAGGPGSAQGRYCFGASRFDTEQPVGSPKVAQLQPIFFHSRRVLRKVFLFDDVLAFPIHLRYHNAESRKLNNDFYTSDSVEFSPPRIFLRCEANETLMADPTCRRHVEKIPCGCSLTGPKCAAIYLNPPVKSLCTNVPVGNKDDLQLVAFSTLFSVTMCVLYLICNLISPANKPKNE